MISTGAATGGVAAAPGVGTAAAAALSLGETASFLEASALFSLAVAEVHGLRIDDLERRRTLLLTVLLGNSGTSFVEQAAGRTGKHWGRLLTEAIPMSTITKVNKVLGRWFVTKYGTKQGILVIGRLAPFGIGAGIGGAGNALFGGTVIAGARRAFGLPDGHWHDEERFSTSPSAGDPADDDAGTCPPETSTRGGQDGRIAAARMAPSSLADELAKLAALQSSGVLSLAEFEQAKKRVT